MAQQKREIWINGEKIKDPLKHPLLAPNFDRMAEYYDLHRQENLSSETELGRIGNSFLIPRNPKELRIKGATYSAIANHFGGFLGRSPDYLNSIIAAWAGSSNFFNRGPHNFGANVKAYHEHVAKNDLAMTHSVLNAFKVVGANRVIDTERALKVIRETDAGIVVHGVRHLATAAAVCDEVAVYAGRMPSLTKDQAEYALAFAIPADSVGLRFIARDAFRPPGQPSDYPLGAGLEEMDLLIAFDNVLVPWERVFIYRDSEAINTLHAVTGSVAHSAHQSVCKSIAKTEFLIGSFLQFVEAHEMNRIPHVQQQIGEALIVLESLRALLFRAEIETTTNSYGLEIPLITALESARALYMKEYPKLIEIARSLGSGNLMMIFSGQALQGESGRLLEEYQGSEHATAKEKSKWNRIIWELSCSSFGTRQDLYERQYAGGLAPSLQFVGQTYPEQELERFRSRAQSVLENLRYPTTIKE